jgi:hypothetical protein
MLKLRPIGPHDYSVFEDGQRIGPIRFAGERTPPIWLWNVNVHLTGGLPMDSASDLDPAKAEFAGAWTALPPSPLAAAFKAMNIRDDD